MTIWEMKIKCENGSLTAASGMLWYFAKRRKTEYYVTHTSRLAKNIANDKIQPLRWWYRWKVCKH